MSNFEHAMSDESRVEGVISKAVACSSALPERRGALIDNAVAKVDRDFFGHSVSTLLSIENTLLAAEFFLARLRAHGDFDSELLSRTLSSLAARGHWFERNELLLTYSLNYSLGDLRRFIPVFLDQLDIDRADRAIEALRKLEVEETFVMLQVSLIIARGDDDVAVEVLQSAADTLSQLMGNSQLCKWLYLLAARRPSLFDKLIEKMGIINLDENVAMVNMSHLIKSLAALQEEERLRSFLLSWAFDPKVENLINDPVFCRSYLFMCDKLGVTTKLLETIYTESGIFCEAEKRAIEFKRNFYREGLQSAFRRFYTVPVTERNGKYLEIPLIVYGEDYLRALREYFLESATTSQEFLDLPLHYQCVISICTTPDCVEEVKEILTPLSDCGFKIDFPEAFSVANKHIVHYRMVFILWCLYRVELKGGVLITLCPDSLFGHGFQRLIERCPVGGGAGGVLVRVGWAEADRSRERGEIRGILRSPRRNSLLAEKSHTDWRHFCCHLSFANISENYRSFTRNGVLYNSWQGVPTVLKPSLGLTEKMLSLSCYRYSNVYADHFGQPMDHELIGHLARCGLLYMPSKPEEFVFVELASDTGYSQLWKFQCPTGYPDNPPVGRIFG